MDPERTSAKNSGGKPRKENKRAVRISFMINLKNYGYKFVFVQCIRKFLCRY